MAPEQLAEMAALGLTPDKYQAILNDLRSLNREIRALTAQMDAKNEQAEADLETMRQRMAERGNHG